MKSIIVINLESGSTQDISTRVREIFQNEGLTAPEVIFIEDDVHAAFEKACDPSPDVLIAYGGDGTANLGAQYAIENNIAFIPLPGGTMNLLPKALYDSDDWEVCLGKALNASEETAFPVCEANKHIFLCGAFVGEPIALQGLREKARKGEIAAGLQDAKIALDAGQSAPNIMMNANGEDVKAVLLMMVCPGVSETQKENLSDPKIEVLCMDSMTSGEWISLGLNALFSDVENHHAVQRYDSAALTVSKPESVPILLDGERFDVEAPVTFKVSSKTLKVLA